MHKWATLMAKNPPAKAGDTGSIPGLGRSPGEGNSNPLQCSCLEKSHGQRSLGGYGPWGCRESDMTGPLNNMCKWLRPLTLFILWARVSEPQHSCRRSWITLCRADCSVYCTKFSSIPGGQSHASTISPSPLPPSYETYCLESNPMNKSIFSETHVLP